MPMQSCAMLMYANAAEFLKLLNVFSILVAPKLEVNYDNSELIE